MPHSRSLIPASRLGEVLEEVIQERGLTMTEAADRLSITGRHLRRLRQGDHPETAAACLRELGCSVEMYAEVER